MSLLKCTECGNEVSSKASSCPNCGAPIKTRKKVGFFGTIIIIIIVALILIGKISNYFDGRAKDQKMREDARVVAQIEIERIGKKEIKEQKHAKEKAEFEASIEDHYARLISALNANNNDGAAELLEPFIAFNKTDYKDVSEIKRKVEIIRLSEKAKALPASKINENLEIYQKLTQLDPSNNLYKKKVAYYSYEKLKQRETREKQKENAELELLTWHWSSWQGYVTAKGQVKNISGKKLERVQAIVAWYDSNGNMVTSNDSFIEYDPIMPGQVSPFRVLERYSPQMKSANIEFRFQWGNRISTIGVGPK